MHNITSATRWATREMIFPIVRCGFHDFDTQNALLSQRNTIQHLHACTFAWQDSSRAHILNSDSLITSLIASQNLSLAQFLWPALRQPCDGQRQYFFGQKVSIASFIVHGVTEVILCIGLNSLSVPLSVCVSLWDHVTKGGEWRSNFFPKRAFGSGGCAQQIF